MWSARCKFLVSVPSSLEALRIKRVCPQHQNRINTKIFLSSLKKQQNMRELDDDFKDIKLTSGLLTIAGFGSLLSLRSAKSTFPNLQNFRPGRVNNWRRVFIHTADIFFKRGIARLETVRLLFSLAEGELLVMRGKGTKATDSPLNYQEFTPETVKAFIQREHEFRFVAISPLTLSGDETGIEAVICASNTDENYKEKRCPPEEFARRWAVHGVQHVWGKPGVLPCRVYLRHCVLAAQSLCPEAEANFLDHTFLSDRETTIRQYLLRNPDILLELPPPDLSARYNG